LFLLVPLTAAGVEYGTLAVMIATGGWLVRHRDRMPNDIVNVPLYFVFMTANYLAYSQYTFGFNAAQLAFVVITTSITAWLLYDFPNMIKEDLARKRRPEDIVRKFTRLVARYTLEIYVLHLAVFDLMMFYAIR